MLDWDHDYRGIAEYIVDTEALSPRDEDEELNLELARIKTDTFGYTHDPLDISDLRCLFTTDLECRACSQEVISKATR